MTTNRHHTRFTTAITILLAFLVLTLVGAPAQQPRSAARPAFTIAAAAHIPAVVGRGRATVTTMGQDEQDSDQPALSYNQALPLMNTVTPGLVDISTTLAGGDGKAGTGIVLSSRGVVMTNYHVISGATAVSVHDLGNGLDYAARIVGVDKVRDIAMLQLAGATHLHTARLGGRVNIGDIVASIGNAGGLADPSLGAGPVVAPPEHHLHHRPDPPLDGADRGHERSRTGRIRWTHGHRLRSGRRGHGCHRG